MAVRSEEGRHGWPLCDLFQLEITFHIVWRAVQTAIEAFHLQTPTIFALNKYRDKVQAFYDMFDFQPRELT